MASYLPHPNSVSLQTTQFLANPCKVRQHLRRVSSGRLTSHNHRPAFTLIEVLLVVIILGILAAIVMPEYTSASTQGRRDSLLAVTQTLRTQIAYYKLQHGDALPDLTANSGSNWALLTQSSTFMGQGVGPYMQTTPNNPINNLINVVDGNGSAPAGASCGYVYDFASGTGTGNIWGTDTDSVTLVTN